MASSIIHLAVTNELTKQHEFKDTDRLKFGAILPDAGYGKIGHLKRSVCGGSKKTYDLERFRMQFGDLMKTDDLYLGYYLHLIQDLCYRHFVYGRYKWDPSIPGNVERLHRDYAIINNYVISKYHLKNDIIVPDHFENEAINGLCSFNTDRLTAAMTEYFKPTLDDDIFFFSREMADEYIGETVEACLRELQAFEAGTGMIESLKNAWDNKRI